MKKLNDSYDNGLDFQSSGSSCIWNGLFGTAELIIQDIEDKEFIF